MKGSIFTAAFVIFVLLLVPAAICTRNISGRNGHKQSWGQPEITTGTGKAQGKRPMYLYWERRPVVNNQNVVKRSRVGPDTVQVAGSSLPDCSHACGSCKPCRLVMVSFVCASLAEAETCPMAYKCMCRNKSYPVP